MMSVASVAPQDWTAAATASNSVAVYSRLMAFKTSSDPDCTGTCRKANTRGSDRQAARAGRSFKT